MRKKNSNWESLGVQVELNSDGKIQLEETINNSIINGDGSNAAANVSDSTLDDSKSVTQNSDKLDASGVDASIVDQQPTAAVLSIDDPEGGEIFKNHLICNNINNNHIPNKTADVNEPVQIAVTKTTVASSNNGDTTNENSTATITSTNGNTTDKANEANGDVVNNDNDTTKRLSNHSNTDAANPVGFLFNPNSQSA